MPSCVNNIILSGLFWYDYGKSFILKLINYDKNFYSSVYYSSRFLQ